MLELDGSDGGGQLVRTALSLSALTGTPFEMEGIRGDRSTPGLRAQHLAAVEAVAAISDADVGEAGAADRGDGETDGNENEADEDDEPGANADGSAEPPDVGTDALTFEPGPISGGEYAVDIGTAGSVTLLLDAVLPLAAALDEPLRLTVLGGTDVAWSPPLDYLRYVKLPLLRRHGLAAALEVDRRGFYPEGGGAVTIHLAPSSLSPLALVDAPRPEAARVYSVASNDLADAEVTDRQAAAATGLLADAGREVTQRVASYGVTRSTGSAVVVRLDAESGPPTGFGALGERGKPAEDVAADAVEAALSFREGPGAVDPHMADQLVPYLALAGGEVAIPGVTDHVETVMDLVGAFGSEVRVERRDGHAVLFA